MTPQLSSEKPVAVDSISQWNARPVVPRKGPLASNARAERRSGDSLWLEASESAQGEPQESAAAGTGHGIQRWDAIGRPFTQASNSSRGKSEQGRCG